MKKRSTLIGLFIKHWDISLFVIIFLGIIPVCLYILALTPSSKGFMFPEDARTWLTYYGAIAGGSMTLWGVAWSISDQNKKRFEDLAVQYKPIPDIILVPDNSPDKNPRLPDTLTYGDEFKGKSHYSIVLEIVNIGRGEMIKLRLLNIQIGIEMDNGSNKTLCNISYTDSNYTNFYIALVPIKKSNRFLIYVESRLLHELINDEETQHFIKGCFQYEDSFNNPYIIEFIIYGLFLKQTIDENNIKNYEANIHHAFPNQYQITFDIRKTNQLT